MPKELRQIQKQDLLPQDSYAKNRKQLRKKLLEFKKNRRIATQPHLV